MADVFLGSVYANLELRNVEGFQRQLGGAGEAGGRFRDTMLGVFAGNLLTAGFQATGAAIAGFAKDAVTGAANLESSMGLLQAVTGATAGQMQALRDQSIALGNDITLPSVSAADASEAMIELGKAGLSVNDIMGASKGVLQAAAAGNIAVGDSAKIVSGALQTFGLKGEDATKVADLLAAAANSSSLELGEVGFALTQAGAQASIAGLSLSETVGIIAQMSNKGIGAQQAGTSLSYMLKSLLSPTEKAAGVMSDLGLKMFDNEGKFIGARAAIEQLQAKTAGLTQEQKAQALSTIFGAEALKAANVVMEDGVAGFDKMQASVGKAGAANDLAKSRQVGFNGALASFQNTIETIAIQVGTVFLPALTGILTTATEVANGVFEGAQKMVGVFSDLIGFVDRNRVAFGLFGAAITLMFSGFLAHQAALAAIRIGTMAWAVATNAVAVAQGILNAVMMTNPIVLIIAAIVALIAVFILLWKNNEGFRNFFIGMWAGIKSAAGAVFDWIGGAIDAVIGFFDRWKMVMLAIVAVAFLPLTIAIGAIVLLIRNWGNITEFIGNVIGTVFNFIAGVVTSVFNTIMGVWNSVLKPVFDAIWFVITALATIWWTIWSGIATVLFTVVSTIVQIIGVILYGIVLFIWNNILLPIGRFFAEVWNGIVTTVTTVVNAIWNVISTIFTAVWNFIVEIFTRVWNFYSSIFMAIFNVVSTAVSNIWNTIVTVFNAVWGFISNLFNTVFGFLRGIWDSIFNTVRNGVTNVFNTVRDILGKVGETVRNVFNGALDIAKGFISSFLNVGKDMINGIVNGVKNGKDAVVNAVKDIAKGALNAVKSFFGIKSPSKVMARMFGYVMEGAEIGIEGGKKSLLDTFNSATNLLPSAVSIPVGLNGGTGYGSSAAARMTAGMGGNSSSSSSSVTTGDVNIYTRQDDSRFLQLISRNQQLAESGIVGAGA